MHFPIGETFVIDSLKPTGELAGTYYVHGFHKQLAGKNGGGEPWKTDGRLYLGVIAQQTTH
jgi:hypothetical protein